MARRSLPNFLFAVLSILIVVALLAVTATDIVKFDQVDWPILLRSETAAAAFFTMVFIAAGVAIRGLRWSVLLQAQPGLTRGQLVAGFAWCFLILQILPFRTGEAARPIWLRMRGGSASNAVSSMIVERLLDVIVLAAILSAGLTSLPLLSGLGVFGPYTGLCVLAFGMIGLVVLSVAAPNAQRLIAPSGKSGFGAIAARLAENLAFASDIRRVLPAVLLSVVAWGLTGAGFVILLTHLLPAGPMTALAVLASVNLSALVTLSPGNLGVFEAVAVAILVTVGISAGEALVVVVLLHLSVLVGQAAAGFVARLVILRADMRRS